MTWEQNLMKIQEKQYLNSQKAGIKIAVYSKSRVLFYIFFDRQQEYLIRKK